MATMWIWGFDYGCEQWSVEFLEFFRVDEKERNDIFELIFAGIRAISVNGEAQYNYGPTQIRLDPTKN